ncbi:MAG: hypothetical protein HYZ25_04310 [Chloroflexi bacterium]|nr:hypothetical protein [Chloroflexota bacterium]
MATRTRQNPDSAPRKSMGKKPVVSVRSFSPREENISVQTFEDQATDRDRLGFEPYVKAIAKFLTNPDTKPPLVLSIEGEWGSGKTSFMLQLKRQLAGYPLIWFDPWHYDKEEELWAVFASRFIDGIIHSAPPGQRVIGHAKRFLRRYQWREGWLDLTLKTIVWVGLLILVIVMGRYAYMLGNQWIQDLYQFASSKDFDPLKLFLESGIELGGVAGFTILLAYVLGKILPLIEDPLKVDLRKYISSTNYEERVPFISKFHRDFKEILDIYVGQKKVFVFVDDLDRCEVPKAADVMSAINLMVGDDKRVIFLIAMDREKVAAGLAVKYEKLLPYILASRSHQGSTFSNRELIGLEFGYEFIEKFVQLPFRIPRLDINKIDDLLKELKQEAVPQETRSHRWRLWFRDRYTRVMRLLRRNKSTAAAPGDSQTPPGREQGQPEPPKSQEETDKLRRREHVIIQVGPETPTFLSLIKQVAVAFDYNPRRIKQFINLFRLRVYIAAETGLFDETPGEKGGQAFTLEKFAKLTALELRWPIFMTDIQGEENTLTELQQLAYGISPQTLSPRVELWRTRRDLMNFLALGSPPSAATGGVASGAWDLSTINLSHVLKVMPSVHVIAPFVPKGPGEAQPPVRKSWPMVEQLGSMEPAPVKTIPPTPIEYIVVDGKVKHNLAGEFCVAYVAEDGIYDFLEKWKKASPTEYARVLGGDNDKPTGIGAIKDMLKVYGYQEGTGELINLEDVFKGVPKNQGVLPALFSKMLETHYLIVGVFIDPKSYPYRLRGAVGTWVVLDRIISDRDEPRAVIYHPYINNIQEYPFSELLISMGQDNLNGLWVPRRTKSNFEPRPSAVPTK